MSEAMRELTIDELESVGGGCQQCGCGKPDCASPPQGGGPDVPIDPLGPH